MTVWILVLSLWVIFISLPVILYVLYIFPVYEHCKHKGKGKGFICRKGARGMKFFIHRTKMIPSHRIRNFMYRKILNISMAEHVVIYFNTEIRAPYNLVIGKGSIIGDNCLLDSRNGVYIGENVNLSSEVHIWTEQHDYRSKDFSCYSSPDMGVRIGDLAWIGSNTIILPRVTIGKGAVICAGAVVTKDVEPYSVVAGVPAKKIAQRPQDVDYSFNGGRTRYY